MVLKPDKTHLASIKNTNKDDHLYIKNTNWTDNLLPVLKMYAREPIL